MTLLLLTLAIACGPKAPPAPPVPATPPVPPAAAAPEEDVPEPAAAAEPADVVNADLKVSVTHADGSTKAGHVKRIERSTDWFGEESWSTTASDLSVTLESSSGATQSVKWPDIKQISVVPGKVPADVDCVYDSDWSPWMYDCTLKTTATATLKDGTRWTVTSRQKWKLTFDDGSAQEFWLMKHPAREQDDTVVTLDSGTDENYDLYTRLQNRLREEVKSTLVTGIAVQ